MLTRIDTSGSRTIESPVIAITPSATIMEPPLTTGMPPEVVPGSSDTQVSESASFGASAYAMLARRGCPSVE